MKDLSKPPNCLDALLDSVKNYGSSFTLFAMTDSSNHTRQPCPIRSMIMVLLSPKPKGVSKIAKNIEKVGCNLYGTQRMTSLKS